MEGVLDPYHLHLLFLLISFFTVWHLVWVLDWHPLWKVVSFRFLKRVYAAPQGDKGSQGGAVPQGDKGSQGGAAPKAGRPSESPGEPSPKAERRGTSEDGSPKGNGGNSAQDVAGPWSPKLEPYKSVLWKNMDGFYFYPDKLPDQQKKVASACGTILNGAEAVKSVLKVAGVADKHAEIPVLAAKVVTLPSIQNVIAKLRATSGPVTGVDSPTAVLMNDSTPHNW